MLPPCRRTWPLHHPRKASPGKTSPWTGWLGPQPPHSPRSRTPPSPSYRRSEVSATICLRLGIGVPCKDWTPALRCSVGGSLVRLTFCVWFRAQQRLSPKDSTTSLGCFSVSVLGCHCALSQWEWHLIVRVHRESWMSPLKAGFCSFYSQSRQQSAVDDHCLNNDQSFFV